VGGANTRAFARNTDLPVTQHDRETDAATVLDELLDAGPPVVVMGNTVDEFMREFEQAISARQK
jgi:hypothetical protein